MRKLRHMKEGNSSLVELNKINPNLAISKISLGDKPRINLPAEKKDEFIRSNKTSEKKPQKVSFCGKKTELTPKRAELFEKIAQKMSEKGLGKYTEGIQLFLKFATDDEIEGLEADSAIDEFIDSIINETNTLENLNKLSEIPISYELTYDAIGALIDVNSDEISLEEFLDGASAEEINKNVGYINLKNIKKGEKLAEYTERTKIFIENIENINGISMSTIKEIVGNKELDNEFLLELAKVINEKTKNGKLIINDNFSKVKAENKGIMLQYIKHMVKVQPYNSQSYFNTLGLDDFEVLCSYRNEYNAPVIEKMLTCDEVSMYEIKSELESIKEEDVDVAIKNMEMFQRLGLKAIRGANYRGEEIDDVEKFRKRAAELNKIYKYSSNCDDITVAICQSDNALEYAKLMNKYSVGPSTISLALQNNIGTDDIETIEKRLNEILSNPKYQNENYTNTLSKGSSRNFIRFIEVLFVFLWNRQSP